MKKSKIITVWLVLLLTVAMLLPLSSVSADPGPVNVALGKPVTLTGSFFTGGWGGGLIVDPNTVTDGTFVPQNQQWDQGPVWWDSTVTPGQYLTIDLQGISEIRSLVIQADDNDSYKLYYWDFVTDAWQLVWDVPNFDIVGGVDLQGMQTRPDHTNNTIQYILPSPVKTRLRSTSQSKSSL